MQTLLLAWLKGSDLESSNFKKCTDVASKSLQEWTFAYRWAIVNKKVFQEITGEDCFMCHRRDLQFGQYHTIAPTYEEN